MRTALTIFGDKMWLYIAFRGVLTPRQVVYSASRSMVSGVSGPAELAPQGWPAAQLFSSSQATQCSYKFIELSILVFTINQVNIYRNPIKLIQGKQPFSPPMLWATSKAWGGGGYIHLPDTHIHLHTHARYARTHTPYAKKKKKLEWAAKMAVFPVSVL